jgi:hypothetical protein
MVKAIRIFLIAVFILSFRASLQAQPAYASTATNCISSFYDPKMYNWFAYSNNCTDVIKVSFVGRDGHHAGTLDIRPGRSGNTGWSEKEVDAMGGVEAYACPEHYIPVDANDKNITKPVTAFRCKYQGF